MCRPDSSGRMPQRKSDRVCHIANRLRSPGCRAPVPEQARDIAPRIADPSDALGVVDPVRNRRSLGRHLSVRDGSQRARLHRSGQGATGRKCSVDTITLLLYETETGAKSAPPCRFLRRVRIAALGTVGARLIKTVLAGHPGHEGHYSDPSAR
jgi:hypothetical protein